MNAATDAVPVADRCGRRVKLSQGMSPGRTLSGADQVEWDAKESESCVKESEQQEREMQPQAQIA